MSQMLSLRHVTKAYPGVRNPRTVLQDVSFSIYSGEFVGVSGPSGSGKSTLLNLCALLDVPTSGDITLAVKDRETVTTSQLHDQDADQIRADCLGMVFQRYSLLPHRTVLDNVMFRYRYMRKQRRGQREKQSYKTRARVLIQEMGLEDVADQPARLLSGGEMQRVAIARAIINEPQLLLADEPTGNLDSANSNLIMDLLKRFNKQRNLTIMMVTHNTDLLGFCDRHLRCEDGRLASCS